MTTWGAKAGWTPALLREILLERSHAQSFTYCLWLLLWLPSKVAALRGGKRDCRPTKHNVFFATWSFKEKLPAHGLGLRGATGNEMLGILSLWLNRVIHLFDKYLLSIYYGLAGKDMEKGEAGLLLDLKGSRGDWRQASSLHRGLC